MDISDDVIEALQEPNKQLPCGSDEYAETEPLKAFLRIRPFANSTQKPDVPFKISPGEVITATPPTHSVYYRAFTLVTESFNFSKIFDDRTDQETIFNYVILPNVERLLKDKSILLFAYGVTGSGKSYTMRGTHANPGIIPRFADVLFNSLSSCHLQYPSHRPVSKNHFDPLRLRDIERCRRLILDESKDDSMLTQFFNEEKCTLEYIDLATTKPASQPEKSVCHIRSEDFSRCSVWCSYFEIYNNDIFDLLLDRKKLSISEDKGGCPYIKNLTYIPVYNSFEVLKVLTLGQKNLRIASTKLNDQSSRSHAIFSVTLASLNENCEIITRSMNFCDLAGSERAKKAQGCFKRLREACGINASLSNLQRCIDMLRKKSKKNVIKPPYRNCKLTRIFQPYFEGYGIVRMIANISFDPDTFDETISVLRFCSLAQQIVTKQLNNASRVKITAVLTQDNEEDVAAHLEELSSIVTKLEQENQTLEQAVVDMEMELDFLTQEWSKQLKEMQDQYNKYLCELKANKKQNHEARKIKVCNDVEQLFKIRHSEQIRKLQEKVKVLTKQRDESLCTIDSIMKVDDNFIIPVNSEFYFEVQKASSEIEKLKTRVGILKVDNHPFTDYDDDDSCSLTNPGSQSELSEAEASFDIS